MPGSAFLEGSRLTLRTVESEDEEFLKRNWNHPSIRQWFPKAEPLDAVRMESFLEPASETVAFLPCEDEHPVGFVWLIRIDDIHERATIAYWITPEEQGNGYATEAVRLALEYAFDSRGLNKVVARVFEDNSASRRVLEKLEFVEEGRLRQHYYVNGEHKDTILFGLVSEDYAEMKRK